MSFKGWAFGKTKEDKWFLMGPREPGGHLSHVSALTSMQHERKAATTTTNAREVSTGGTRESRTIQRRG